MFDAQTPHPSIFTRTLFPRVLGIGASLITSVIGAATTAARMVVRVARTGCEIICVIETPSCLDWVDGYVCRCRCDGLPNRCGLVWLDVGLLFARREGADGPTRSTI